MTQASCPWPFFNTLERNRVRLLVALARRSEEELHERILGVASELTNPIKWAIVVTSLVPNVNTKIRNRIFHATLALSAKQLRADTLAAFLPYLATASRSLAVHAILKGLSNGVGGPSLTKSIAPYLNAPEIAQVLDYVERMESWGERAGIMAILASYASGAVQQRIFELAHKVPGQQGRAEVLRALAPNARGPLLKGIFEAALALSDEAYRAEVLAALAPFASEQLREQILSSALGLSQEGYRVQVFVRLGDTIARALFGPESVVRMNTRNALNTSQFLRGLAGYAVGPLLERILLDVNNVDSVERRAVVLAALAPFASEQLHERIFNAALALSGLFRLRPDRGAER